MSAQLCDQPISSAELNRLTTVYEIVCRKAGMPRDHPNAERIAAIAIRFYQLGIRDEEILVETVLCSYQLLSETPVVSRLAS
jgi:hypothetical protein